MTATLLRAPSTSMTGSVHERAFVAVDMDGAAFGGGLGARLVSAAAPRIITPAAVPASLSGVGA